MNNALLFFFNINVSEIKKINNNYYFRYLNSDYGVYFYERDIEEALEIYYLNLELITSGFGGYEIILTKDNEVLFGYENNYYVLMKLPNVKNRLINFYDVISFYYVPTFKIKKLDKSNWSYNWSNKIDFIEYQFDQIRGKYKMIDASIDYFIGMWENAISYYNDNVNTNGEKIVCHKRIDVNMDLLDFLNPLNFVVDYKERDRGEFLKSFVLNNNYTESILNEYLRINNLDDIVLLIARILFPSYYFDLYEEVVLDNRDESDIEKILKKKDNILYLILYIFNRFNNYNIPVIDWIKKEISR